MKRISVIFVFLFGLCSGLLAEANDDIRELVSRMRVDDVLLRLDSGKVDENSLWQLAYCYYKKNNFTKLIELLEHADVPLYMSAYRYWLLGYAYSNRGRIDDAIDAYSHWMSDTTFPNYEDCAFAYFDLLVERGRYAQAESLLRVFYKFGFSSRLRRSAPVKELELLVKTKPDSAKQILTNLLNKKPTTWVYELLEKNFSPLTAEQYLKGGSLYYQNKRFRQALERLERCKNLIKKGSPLWGEYLYAQALVYTNMPSERKRAVKLLKELLAEALYDSVKCRVLLGQVYRALGDKEKAIKELLFAINSADIVSKKVGLWNLAELYRHDHMWDKCAPLFAQYWKTAGRDDELADNSVLWAGLSYYLCAQYDSAMHYFSTIVDQYGRGYEPFEQTALWWKAKSLMKTKDYNSAYVVLDSIISLGAREYYYYKARFFCGDFDTTQKPPEERLDILWQTFLSIVDSVIGSRKFSVDYIPESVNLIRARYFSELGILEWGEKEFQRHITSGGKYLSLSQTWRLFRLADSLGYKNTAYILAIRTSRDIPDTLLSRLLRYPLFFPEEVESVAKEYGISPFLLLALIRQESAFDIYSTSFADARGLTQITPNTGKRIAKEINIEDYSDLILYDYKLNIRMGAYELKRLIDDCDGNLLCALARYNGGDERIALWMNYPKDEDEELFVENIDYHETRHYTKLVLANYFSYIDLWKAIR